MSNISLKMHLCTANNINFPEHAFSLGVQGSHGGSGESQVETDELNLQGRRS